MRQNRAPNRDWLRQAGLRYGRYHRIPEDIAHLNYITTSLYSSTYNSEAKVAMDALLKVLICIPSVPKTADNEIVCNYLSIEKRFNMSARKCAADNQLRYKLVQA